MIIMLVMVTFIIIGLFLYLSNKPEPSIGKTLKVETPKPTEDVIVEPPKLVINEASQLNLPYTTQAPFANWNIHEESCEEAALLMVHYYLIGSQIEIIPPAAANQELIDMVSWQKTNYSQEKDLNMSEMGKLATDYYGYKSQVTEDITADNIKQAISEGKPVMVPIITHALGNPYYGPNPTYHILVIKGYNPTGVITNDAGVKEVKDYFYSWDTLWRAIDAQTAQMNQGRDMLVVTK